MLDQYCAIGCAGWESFGFDVLRRGIALHVKLVAFRVYGAWIRRLFGRDQDRNMQLPKVPRLGICRWRYGLLEQASIKMMETTRLAYSSD